MLAFLFMKLLRVVLCISAIVLAACEDEVVTPPPPPQPGPSPTLMAHNPMIGWVRSNACDSLAVVADIPAGFEVAFTLKACPADNGAPVSGYRYGWDILDLDDPEQWEIDYTPFPGAFAPIPPRVFSFGTHTFTAEAIDSTAACSRVHVKCNVVRFTGERNLLIIDDYRADEVPGQSGWVETNGGVPSDAQHDEFWLDQVSNVDGFDPGVDVVAARPIQGIAMTTLTRYKNVIWSVFGDVESRTAADQPLLYSFIQYRSTRLKEESTPCWQYAAYARGTVTTDAVALAMQAGIHVMIAGNHPVQHVVPRFGTFKVEWPMIPLYELELDSRQTGNQPTFYPETPGEHGFAYRALCLDAIDYGLQTFQRLRHGTGSNRPYCPVIAYRTPNSFSLRDDTMRHAIPFDPAFPPLDLRIEAAGTPETPYPWPHYAVQRQGLDAEVYNPAYFRQGAACEFVPPPRPCFEPIYGLGCLDTSEPTYDQPVAFWTSAYADVVNPEAPGSVAARSVVFGFPPVFFEPAQVKPGIEHILFDEWQLPRR